ncbi:MAG: hypothetical protein WCP85_28435 [Mariniphaga sp.]
MRKAKEYGFILGSSDTLPFQSYIGFPYVSTQSLPGTSSLVNPGILVLR